MLKADVVISKPRFRHEDGRPAADIAWPIDDIITTLGMTVPRKLAKLEAVIFALVHANGALLGSCASNVFRTEVLRRFPFPTDFGTAGDGAWGLQHAAEVAWGVMLEKFSSFLLHPTNASAAERRSTTRPGDGMPCCGKAWPPGGVRESSTTVKWLARAGTGW